MLNFKELLELRFKLTEIVGTAKYNCNMDSKSVEQEEKIFDLIDHLPHNIVLSKDNAKVFLRCIFRTVLIRHNSLSLGAKPNFIEITQHEKTDLIFASNKYDIDNSIEEKDFIFENANLANSTLLNKEDIEKARKLISVITQLLLISSQVDSKATLDGMVSTIKIQEKDIEELLKPYHLEEHSKMLYFAIETLKS